VLAKGLVMGVRVCDVWIEMVLVLRVLDRNRLFRSRFSTGLH